MSAALFTSHTVPKGPVEPVNFGMAPEGYAGWTLLHATPLDVEGWGVARRKRSRVYTVVGAMVETLHTVGRDVAHGSRRTR
jgi:hypothetical protein